MKKLKIIDGTIGQEYVSRGGKIVQLVDKTTNSARVLVLATNSEITIPGNHFVFEMNPEEEENKSVEGLMPIDQQEESMVPMSGKDDTNMTDAEMVDEDDSEGGGKMTAKQLVWDMLKAGPQTREALAKAVIARRLSKHSKDVKKVKSYVSVIISGLKKKEKVKIVSLGPGKYSVK